jgi:hypothetical protein
MGRRKVRKNERKEARNQQSKGNKDIKTKKIMSEEGRLGGKYK